MANKFYESKAWLHDQFKAQGRTKAQIAATCGVNEMTIRRWLLKHGITERL